MAIVVSHCNRISAIASRGGLLLSASSLIAFDVLDRNFHADSAWMVIFRMSRWAG